MGAIVKQVPPLKAGDVLTRDEFLRLWDAHPEIKKAELIGGIVYMPSPVGFDHGDYDNRNATWLGTYAAFTPGTRASSNATALMGEDAPQPDEHLRLLAEAGGRTGVVDKLLTGPPELASEIVHTSAAYDLHQKRDLYEASGVFEYVAILLHEQEIRWHLLQDGKYQLLEPSPGGVWKSVTFPGLWLHGPAMLAEDMAKVLATLRRGLRSAEHAKFVEQLRKKMKRSK